jgi:hypothetical protein
MSYKIMTTACICWDPVFAVATPFSAFGIFDGHGGKSAATFASKELLPTVTKLLDRCKTAGVCEASQSACLPHAAYLPGFLMLQLAQCRQWAQLAGHTFNMKWLICFVLMPLTCCLQALLCPLRPPPAGSTRQCCPLGRLQVVLS